MTCPRQIQAIQVEAAQRRTPSEAVMKTAVTQKESA